MLYLRNVTDEVCNNTLTAQSVTHTLTDLTMNRARYEPVLYYN